MSDMVVSLDEAQSWKSTRCSGWSVRGLVALATPADMGPDRDAVTYWLDEPGAPDPESRGIRALRSMASQSSLGYLVTTYAETATAVRTLARRTSMESTVTTQKHVLRVDDLLATLVVEATIHHLDMIVELNYPGPADAGLAVVRSTLDGLLGQATPPAWSDTDWALVATGRLAPMNEHRAPLGLDVDRLPLLR